MIFLLGDVFLTHLIIDITTLDCKYIVLAAGTVAGDRFYPYLVRGIIKLRSSFEKPTLG